MPRRPKSRCPGCKTLHEGRGRCPRCRQALDRTRGTAAERGYTGKHVSRFRPGVLDKHPFCVCTREDHRHGPVCGAPSTVADHWPLSRRELVANGMDPDDPQHGRGLCESCHNSETNRNQPRRPD